MSRRPAILLLLTTALLGAGVWMAWQWHHRTSATPAAHPPTAATVPAIPPRWQPLFLPAPATDRNNTIALARSADATFQPVWLLEWTARISSDPAFLLSKEEAFLAFNEVVETLRLKVLHLDSLEATLLRILSDPTAHEILRDYSGQHLALLAEAHPESVHRILTAFCVILEAPGSHLAWGGTLLNASQQLLTRRPQAAPAFLPRLADITHRFSTAPDVALPLRISLIQSFAHGSNPIGLSVLRCLAADPSESSAILMATAGSLGQCGTPADLPLLQEIQKRGDMASVAAATAVTKLHARFP